MESQYLTWATAACPPLMNELLASDIHLPICLRRESTCTSEVSNVCGSPSHQVQRAHGIDFLTPMRPHVDPKLFRAVSDEFPLGGLRRMVKAYGRMSILV
eukprot:4378264-Amphidinium_carterae.1